MALDSYTALQTSIGDWLLRSDLSGVIPDFITLLEAKLRRDPRARKQTDRGTFSITADGDSLPSDLQSIETWTHDGPTYHFPIKVVDADALSNVKADLGGDATGVPRYAAAIAGTVRYAPEPDQTYSTKMTYLQKLEALNAGNPSNWLLADHPDIYLYGSLLEAAPYLKDDDRIPVWETRYEKAMNELHKASEKEQFGGAIRRPIRPIGG